MTPILCILLSAFTTLAVCCAMFAVQSLKTKKRIKNLEEQISQLSEKAKENSETVESNNAPLAACLNWTVMSLRYIMAALVPLIEEFQEAATENEEYAKASELRSIIAKIAELIEATQS